MHVLSFSHKSYLYEGGSVCSLWRQAHADLHGAEKSSMTSHAAVFGSLARLVRAQKLYSHYTFGPDTRLQVHYSAYQSIGCYGDLNALKAPELVELRSAGTFLAGCGMSGHLDKVKWTLEDDKNYREIRCRVRYIVRGAASSGHRSILAWATSII